MLDFFSASSNEVESKKAMRECLEKVAHHGSEGKVNLLIIHSSIGHDFEEMLSEARRIVKKATIVGCTGSGVISREGPNEAMRSLAIMACMGDESAFAVATAKPFTPERSFDTGASIAAELKKQIPDIHSILFYPTFFNLLQREALEGIESVVGDDVVVFGGISFDNMKFITSYQFYDTQVIEKGTFAVGIADPSLEAITAANHSFRVVEPALTVTKTAPGLVKELNGKPAWKAITETVGMPEQTPLEKFILLFSGFVRKLDEEFREEYGSDYIPLFISFASLQEDGGIVNSALNKEGDKIWLLKRDEKSISEGINHLNTVIKRKMDKRHPRAVFQADCALRGKLMFNKIDKEEIINSLQTNLAINKDLPWLGLYGSGEYAQIKRKNFSHVFTTSLCVLVDKENIKINHGGYENA